MGFKSISKLDQLRNEYQWWLEQRMTAIREADFDYKKECDESLRKLWEDILEEYPKSQIQKPKKKTLLQRLFGIG